MSPDNIKAIVDQDYPDLVAKPRRSPDGWSFYCRAVQRGANPTRIARAVQRRPGAPTMFKPAVSARLQRAKAMELAITGGAHQVRELLDRELALWRAHFESSTATGPRVEPAPVPRSKPTPLLQIEAITTSSVTELEFEFVQGSIDPTKPLIYLWEVLDPAGTAVFSYVGKAKNGAGRPIEHYRRNVRNLLAGRAYRPAAPGGYRKVHQRLAQAMIARERVRLSFLCNVLQHENINEVEHRLQREHGC